jgi:RHS repeat-associated protein
LYVFFLLAGIVYTHICMGADESYIKTLTGKIKKGDSCVVVDDKFNQLPIDLWNRVNNISVDNVISLELRQDTNVFYHSKPFKGILEFSLFYYTTRDQEKPTEKKNIKLQVSFDTAKGSNYAVESIFNFKSAFKVILVVNSLSSPEMGENLLPIFRVKNQILINRKYPFTPLVEASLTTTYSSDNFSKKGISSTSKLNPGDPNGIKPITVSWNSSDLTGYPEGFGVPEAYDLEWTWLDEEGARGKIIKQNYGGVTGPFDIPGAVINDFMQNDNTRVTITSQSYTINPVFLQGYLIFRVRGVWFDPVTFIRRTTDWQYINNTNNSSCIYFGENDFCNYNWQYTAAYAEEGKRKEVVTFFDASLRSRQTVTISGESALGKKVVVAAETIYDIMGRPAASILPAPLNDDVLGFKRKLNTNQAGGAYSYKNLILGCTVTANPMSQSSGASQYYSNANPFLAITNNPITKYIPDAGGYPFSVTEYTPDNTGRVRRQGGVGPEFAPGSGHETNYFYGKPTQTDLDRIFGMEVGNASHYLKNMVVDANGQTSISYLDAKGKTIATALAGNAPKNTDALPSATNAQATTRFNQVFIRPADFKPDVLKLEANATFIAATSGTFKLNYNVDPTKLITSFGNNQQLCNSCYYTVKIRVKDNCGIELATASTAAFTINNVSCGNVAVFTGFVNIEVPQAGEYFVTYSLELSEDLITWHTNYFLNTNTDIKTLQTFFQNELLQADLSGCYSECSTCKTKLGTRAEFTAKIKKKLLEIKNEMYSGQVFNQNASVINDWINDTYTNLFTNCAAATANCIVSSPCEESLTRMKYNVVPGGQYLLFDPGTFQIPDNERLVSILYLNKGVSQNYKNDPQIPNYTFTDANGADRQIKDADVTDAILIQAYIQHPEWADAFVKRHIEYCSYEWCRDYGSGSFAFDEMLREKITSGQDATSRGFYSRTNYKAILDANKDPFFATGGIGAAYKQEMVSDLQNFSQVLNITLSNNSVQPLAVKNILQYIDWLLYCKVEFTGSNSQDVINSWNNCIASAGCRSATREWDLYREYYLKLKSKYVAFAKRRDKPGCINCFIGGDPSAITATQNCAQPGCSATIEKGDVTDINLQPGARLYSSYNPQNGSGSSIVVSTPEVWKPTNNTNGPINRSGIWPNTQQPGSFELDAQVFFPENKTYFVGIFSTTTFLFKLDGTTIVTYPDQVGWIWRIYPVEITAGLHTITVGSGNANTFSTLGCEIYNNTANELQSATRLSDLRTIWSSILLLKSTGDICSPKTPRSTCTSDYRYNLYIGKQRIFDEKINEQQESICIQSTPYANRSAATLALRNNIRQSLEEISQNWKNKLLAARDAEFSSAAITEAKINTLISRLVAVASKYIDIAPVENLRIVSSLPKAGDAGLKPGDPVVTTTIFSTFNDNNFSDAFNAVIPPAQVQQGFGPDLLEQPYPYNKKPVSNNTNSGDLDNIICNDINQIKWRLGGSPDIATLHNYLQAELAEDYILSQTELQDLINRCAAGCRYTNEPYTLPVAFTVPPAGGGSATDRIWATCTQISTWRANFSNTYPNVAPGTNLHRVLLANFLNHNLGFAFSWDEYEAFSAKCLTDAGATLYNKPATPLIVSDDFSCAANIISSVAETAGQGYAWYRDSVKLAFRNNYISRCLSAKASAKLEYDQTEYHYTLYYYDQAGNLVKTIPPAGVKLLGTKDLEEVATFRDFDPASCTGVDANAVTNQIAVLNSLSAGLDNNSTKSIETWLYQAAAGTTRQVRLITPDKKWLWQLAVSATRLWAELYQLSPKADGSIEIVLSSHASADITALTPIQAWSHIVVQSAAGLPGSTPDLYFDGRKLTPDVFAGAPPYPYDLDIDASTGTLVLPANVTATLKHLRTYNRVATEAEVWANFSSSCLAPVNALAVASNPLTNWGRFNVPAAGSATTIGAGSTTEFAARLVVPDHRLPTTYLYNSLGSVVSQTTPDAGKSDFWYDRLGRLAVSRNTEQASPVLVNADNPSNRYSYTLYDDIGRITEVGEKVAPATVMNEATARTEAQLNTWLASGNNRQVTVTVYDAQPAWVPASLTGTQRNIRNRVAVTALIAAGSNPAINRKAASYYSYDLLGNADLVVQENTDYTAAEATFISSGDRLKRIKYDYDLVSGKVNKVSYQAGKWDQFFYRYLYDSENRITEALSSRTDLASAESWIKEAAYTYYLHGPLARVELGKNRVQGIDYAYTLQGWLRGVNSNVLDPNKDMGGDGKPGSPPGSVARDIFGFNLGYFQGDYSAAGGAQANAFGLTYTAPNAITPGATGKSLFNGNISQAAYAIAGIESGAAAGYSYRYDQLNRLLEMSRHTIGTGAATWSNSSIINAYNEKITYDANGNIKTFIRNGTAAKPAMDNLTYFYNTGTDGYLTSNRLRHVKDAVPASAYSAAADGIDDIDDQTADNYGYDRIGNLVKDNPASGISRINWTVYGKIASITKTGGNIAYSYDAAGNRISKIVNGVTTFYVRDAQGNLLALYTKDATTLKWDEQHLYGSSRVGMARPGFAITTARPNDVYSAAADPLANGIEGKRSYELTNHLGNVLATISDRKLAVPLTGNPGQINYYTAELLSSQDYYTFGMQMPGRNSSSTTDRYGFNGKENDNEVKGTGNQQDYGMRIYDPRLGRFLSVDPITKDYPELTPYQFASNSPISGVDLDGREYYYAADGTLLRKYGDNTQVMLVNKDFVEKAKDANVELLNKNSTSVGMTNAELNTRAFLTTIRQTENKSGEPLNYNNWNGFANGHLRRFTEKDYSEENKKEYENHPGFPTVGKDKKGNPIEGKSSAAGAYQILSNPFKGYKKQLGLTDFSPMSQDKIAMAMIDYRKARKDIANADLESATTKLVIRKGGEQFASLPGGSQSNGLTLEKFRAMFQKNVANELTPDKSVIATPKGQLTNSK